MKQFRLSDGTQEAWQRGNWPLHRSLPFYCGLFPIVLLLWAWADSRTHWTLWQLRRGVDRAVWIELEESALRLGETATQNPGETYSGGSHSRMPAKDTIAWSRESIDRPLETWFPQPRTVRKREGGHSFPAINHTYQVLPLWLVLLCYLPLWLAFTAWRAWRISVLGKRLLL